MLKQPMIKLVLVMLLSCLGQQTAYPVSWRQALEKVGSGSLAVLGRVGGVLERSCEVLHPAGQLIAGYILLTLLHTKGIHSTAKMLTTPPMVFPCAWYLLTPVMKDWLYREEKEEVVVEGQLTAKPRYFELASRGVTWLQYASLVYFITLASTGDSSHSF